MDPVLRAKSRLRERRDVQIGENRVEIVLLVPEKERIPFEARWWRKKEASIIAVDVNGNFFLRSCDGSVLFLNQESKSYQVVAPSVSKFVDMIE